MRDGAERNHSAISGGPLINDPHNGSSIDQIDKKKGSGSLDVLHLSRVISMFSVALDSERVGAQRLVPVAKVTGLEKSPVSSVFAS